MPTTDGVFVLDAQPPREVDGVMQQRINLMFVFEMDPFDIGGTVRAKLTPAHRDGDPDGDWLLPESAQLLMPTVAPQIIIALDAGEAIYRMVAMQFDYPINVPKEKPQIRLLWHQLSQAGQKVIATERFKLAGTWIEFDPSDPPDLPDPVPDPIDILIGR